MVCLRCGYCCKNMFVAVVKDPDKGIVEGNIHCQYGDGRACIHLKGKKPGEYSCEIHHYPWYVDTPCFAHGQFEKSVDDPCRIGRFILKKKEKHPIQMQEVVN